MTLSKILTNIIVALNCCSQQISAATILVSVALIGGAPPFSATVLLPNKIAWTYYHRWLMDGCWNHNIHYHPILLEAVPNPAGAVLDVGCGVGVLSRALRDRAARVVGIDLDEASIAVGRGSASGDIEYIVGDFLTHPLEPESFDAVVSVATLHHLDAAAGLRRMRELVRPGGVVGVIGLARDTTWADHARSVAGLGASWMHKVTKKYWEHPSRQVWPPPENWESMRRLAERELPGVRYRRHLLWRYSLVWTKPRETSDRGGGSARSTA